MALAAIPKRVISEDCVIPEEVKKFFKSFYDEPPQVSEERGNLIYFIPEQGQGGLRIRIDPFRGCHIITPQVEALGPSPAYMKQVIQKFIDELKQTKDQSQQQTYDSVWIDTPNSGKANRLFSVLPDSFELGRPGYCQMMVDIQKKVISIWQWINPKKECSIPPGATHNNGAAAVLMDRTAKKVLLVVDKYRSDHWELPGGGYDAQKDKSSSDTALREAVEEGGLKVEVKDLLRKIEEGSLPQPIFVCRRQLDNTPFAPCINEIWAYFIDGISQEKLHPQEGEVLRAEWIDIDRILGAEESLDGLPFGKEIKASVFAAVNGAGLGLVLKEEGLILHTPMIKA